MRLRERDQLLKIFCLNGNYLDKIENLEIFHLSILLKTKNFNLNAEIKSFLHFTINIL